jgi:hypothetical protein
VLEYPYSPEGHLIGFSPTLYLLGRSGSSCNSSLETALSYTLSVWTGQVELRGYNACKYGSHNIQGFLLAMHRLVQNKLKLFSRILSMVKLNNLYK